MGSFSRRAILNLAAWLPALFALRTTNADAADGDLLSLGQQFDAVVAELDDIIENGNPADRLFAQFDSVETRLIATPASSIDGLRVKARAACWALLGDLDSGDESTTDKRMALSIVRDLIRLYDPGLEPPGAVQALVAGIEKSAASENRACDIPQEAFIAALKVDV